MKRIGIIAMAVALIFGLSQCKKEQSKPTNEGGTVAITLDIKHNGSTRMDVNTGTGEVTYHNGDVIYVASGGKYIGTLTHNGTSFSGTITDPVVGEPLHFYFLGNVEPAETLTVGTTQSCSVVISDQTEHLPVIEYAPSNENYSSGMTAFSAMLLNKCALVKFNVTTYSESATCITGFNNKVTVDFSGNNFAYSQKSDGVITLPAGNGEKWAILLPQEALAAGEAGSAYSVDGVYTGTRGAVSAIGINNYLTTGIEVEVASSYSGCESYGWVNLGLPSGTLWATRNVGASSPEDYGDYFAWAETQPKSVYDWSTYSYCCNNSENSLTKYCNYISICMGCDCFHDTLTILQTGDDAAAVNWSGEARTPSINEWQELHYTCTSIWTTLNGVSGKLLTGLNGNKLFLPAAGRREGNEIHYADHCFYWSTWLNLGNPNYAVTATFMLDNPNIFEYGFYRYYGLSVRAVRSAK